MPRPCPVVGATPMRTWHAPIPGSEITIPLKLTRWAYSTFPRPHIDPEWLGECYHWFRKAEAQNEIDYIKLLLFIVEQILESDLKDSTVHGTGFGLPQPTVAENLLGPRLLVQVVALTEVARPHKPRGLKFKLSDGERVIDAYANASLSSGNLDFDSIELGSKVSRTINQYSDGEKNLIELDKQMFLINPILQNGVLLLQPHTFTLLGGKNCDLLENQIIQRSKK